MQTTHMNMKQHTRKTNGFTAVELLITLFVAVIFLMAGYMLYGTILQRSSEARLEAQADNLAYNYLRQYEATAPTGCVASTPLNKYAETSPAANGLTKPLVTVQITCPISGVTRLSEVSVKVEYSNGGKANYVQHEIFASEK